MDPFPGMPLGQGLVLSKTVFSCANTTRPVGADYSELVDSTQHGR